jgi:hypothetical protein
LGAKTQDPITGAWVGRKHVLGKLRDRGSGSGMRSIPAAMAERVEALLAVGCTVRRGPDWRWGKQDGGGGDETHSCDGTVTEVDVAVVVSGGGGGGGGDGEGASTTPSPSPSGVVRVQWQKTGLSEVYSCGGRTQMYDVLPVAALSAPQAAADFVGDSITSPLQ